MKNICRPFVLYNDFLPPVPDVHQQWQFLSLGYNDGITVGDNLLEENDGCFDFQAMWKYQVQYVEQMGNGCSSHILWGVRSESKEKEEGGMRDADFWREWDEKPDYPFLFVPLLQGCNKVSRSEREEMEKRLTEKGSHEVITYLTFDNSDFILVLKCTEYAKGAKIINQFHYGVGNLFPSAQEGCPVYSFTIASVNRRFLMEDQLLENVMGVIPHAYIYVIERYPGSVSNIYQGIKNQLGEVYVSPKETVLGCNDEVIVVRDVPWNKFLKFFRYNVKVSDEPYVRWLDSLTGITTIIGQPAEPEARSAGRGSGQNGNGGRAPENREKKLMSDIMRDMCTKFHFESQGDDARMGAIKRNIYQTINSLRKFEETPVRDYLFQIIFMPLNMVLDIGQDVGALYQKDFIVNFYEFMKGLNLYAQNSDKSDRQFVQSIDLKIRIYDTPVKLNAFYNAFIFFTAQFLTELDSLLDSQGNEPDSAKKNVFRHEYEFLACPGVANNLRVQEMFKGLSRTKRLFLVEMPESQVYSPKTMLVMLAHEVGHFVGRNVRLREGRMSYAAEIMGMAVAKYVKSNIRQYLPKEEFAYIDDDYWTRVKQTIADELREFDSSYENYLTTCKFVGTPQEHIEQMKDMLDKRRYHSELLRQILNDGIKVILSDEDNSFWDYICEKDFIYLLEKGETQAQQKKAELKVYLQKRVDELLMYKKWESNTITVYSIIDMLVYLFKECIADLIAVLTLGLTLKDYLEATLYSVESQGYGHAAEPVGEDARYQMKIIDIRRGLVVYCMTHGDDQEFRWKIEQAREVIESKEKDLRIVWKDTWNLISEYMGSELKVFPDMWNDGQKNDDIVKLFLDGEIINSLVRYLMESKEKFISCRQEELWQHKEQLRRMYRLFETEDIVGMAEEMQEYTERFLDEIEQRKNEEIHKWEEKKSPQPNV